MRTVRTAELTLANDEAYVVESPILKEDQTPETWTVAGGYSSDDEDNLAGIAKAINKQEGVVVTFMLDGVRRRGTGRFEPQVPVGHNVSFKVSSVSPLYVWPDVDDFLDELPGHKLAWLRADTGDKEIKAEARVLKDEAASGLMPNGACVWLDLKALIEALTERCDREKADMED